MIERIFDGDKEIAVIIRNDFDKKGIEFVTDDAYSQQVAYMHHETGHTIIPHFHNLVERTVQYTQEVLVIKEGKLQVDFYHDNMDYYKSTILEAGDIILLCAGGHGFEVIEEVKMVEIKQGPYMGEADKTRFERRN